MTTAAAVRRALRAARDRPPARWLGCAAPAVTLAWVAGPPGAAAGLAVAVAGLASVPTAVALGHVWLVALLPPGTGLPAVATAEAGLLALLVAPDRRGGVGVAAATLAAAALLTGLAWLVLRQSGSVAVAGTFVLVAVGVAAAGAARSADGRLSAVGGQP